MDFWELYKAIAAWGGTHLGMAATEDEDNHEAVYLGRSAVKGQRVETAKCGPNGPLILTRCVLIGNDIFRSQLK